MSGTGTRQKRSAVQAGLVCAQVIRIEDDRGALGELVRVMSDGVAIERHQYVGRQDVAVDRMLAHAQVVGVVAALDEGRVLGEVEGVKSRVREYTRQRLAGCLDAEARRAADAHAKLAGRRS